MRILLVNKFYYPQGGADKHVLQLESMLKERGHEVAVFAMQDSRNLPTPWAKYFVSAVDFSRVKFNWQGLRAVGRTLYSFEAARKMRALINDFRPDVVHVHNIYHQISPSILPVIRRAGIPIVQTQHDYALISANYNLYAHGGICQHGRQGRYYEYVLHRCIKNSLAASFLAMIDQWRHKRSQVYEKHIGTFISPSRFLRDLVLDWEKRELDIKVIPNFVAAAPEVAEGGKEDYVLYVGRLSGEKGVDVLLRALAGTDVKLKIVGAGPDETKLRALADVLNLRNVEWLGTKSGGDLREIMAKAAALVVPSKWYENCPLVILEAYASGTPVIGARIGGIPEFVREGETGFLFRAGDENELKLAIKKMLEDRPKREYLGTNALIESAKFSIEEYYRHLMNVYETVRLR